MSDRVKFLYTEKKVMDSPCMTSFECMSCMNVCLYELAMISLYTKEKIKDLFNNGLYEPYECICV